MTTVLQICTRALRRLGVIDALHTPSSEDAQAALDALNELHAQWKARGVETLAPTFALGDGYAFFVPPSGEPIDDIDSQGDWDASTNTPTLASATGTEGHAYRVSVAGSTTLDGVTSWSAGDYAVFEGTVWQKGKSSVRHEAAVVALLAMRLCDDYGKAPSDMIRRDASSGWYSLMADYVKPTKSRFDTGLIDTATGRLTGIVE